MTQQIKLTLPYPPSVNTYWGFRGSRRFLTKKAVEFKKHVWAAFTGNPSFVSERLQISIYLYPPDKRVRDIDNVCKPLLDSLVQAGAMSDDSQIDRLTIERMEIVKEGKCIIELQSIVR